MGCVSSTALRRAADLIEAASRVTHRELAPRLADSLGSRLSLLTGARYVEVNVDTDHFALGLLGRERPDMVPLDAVSHGTRDQVALLLRLALCEVLGGAGERTPLLLDEPLLTSDPVAARPVHRVSARSVCNTPGAAEHRRPGDGRGGVARYRR